MASKVLAGFGRVKVRRFRRGDLKERIAWPPYEDALLAHLNRSFSSFFEREKWLVARITNSGRMYFAVEDENGELIGEMSLRHIDARAKSARLGVHLAPDKLSMGYGREALTALFDYYFNEMGFRVMFLDVAAYNKRAIRLYEHLHFRYLSPFWRMDRSGLPIFSDPSYSNIRKYFRRRGSLLECRFYDMALRQDEYLKARPEIESAAGPKGRDDADAETTLLH